MRKALRSHAWLPHLMLPRLKQRIVLEIVLTLSHCNPEPDRHQTNSILAAPALTPLNKTEFTTLKPMASKSKEPLYSTTNYLLAKSIENPSSNSSMRMECFCSNSKREIKLLPCINQDGLHRVSPSTTNLLKVLISNSLRRTF